MAAGALLCCSPNVRASSKCSNITCSLVAPGLGESLFGRERSGEPRRRSSCKFSLSRPPCPNLLDPTTNLCARATQDNHTCLTDLPTSFPTRQGARVDGCCERFWGLGKAKASEARRSTANRHLARVGVQLPLACVLFRAAERRGAARRGDSGGACEAATTEPCARWNAVSGLVWSWTAGGRRFKDDGEGLTNKTAPRLTQHNHKQTKQTQSPRAAGFSPSSDSSTWCVGAWVRCDGGGV